VRVDLNFASIDELTGVLHGIGSNRARAIVAGRPFGNPEELVTRGILTERRYNRIADLLTVAALSTNGSTETKCVPTVKADRCCGS
jgi:DNA uptake protein ComE-like DNA-binding protein